MISTPRSQGKSLLILQKLTGQVKIPMAPETFEKCSILVKFKEGENFNRRNTLSISRIEI